MSTTAVRPSVGYPQANLPVLAPMLGQSCTNVDSPMYDNQDLVLFLKF
jgi:hypothetical protein